MQCRGGTIEFYADGALRSCEIEAVHEVHTAAGWVKCAGGHTMTRHRNGKLESCVLSAPVQIDGLDCGSGERAHFGDDGRPAGCE